MTEPAPTYHVSTAPRSTAPAGLDPSDPSAAPPPAASEGESAGAAAEAALTTRRALADHLVKALHFSRALRTVSRFDRANYCSLLTLIRNELIATPATGDTP